MYQDVWNSDVFTNVSMTTYITKKGYVPSFMEKNFPAQVDVSLTQDFAVDVERHRVYLLPITPRGGQLPSAARSERFASKFPIPRFGETETVLNASVMGVRETGTINLRTVETVRNQKLALIQNRINMSWEWARVRALDGLIVDPVSGVVVFNTHTALGTTPSVVNYDFGVGGSKFNLFLIALKRFVEDTAGDYQENVTEYVLICGRTFYRALLNDPVISAAYLDYQVKTATLRFAQSDRQIPGGFMLADNVRIVDAGNARIPTFDNTGAVNGSNGYVDDNSAYLVPNFPGNSRVMYGPSDCDQFIGTVLPYYVAQKSRDYGEGIDIRCESYATHYFARPEMNVRIIGHNINVPTTDLAQFNPSGFGL